MHPSLELLTPLHTLLRLLLRHDLRHLSSSINLADANLSEVPLDFAASTSALHLLGQIPERLRWDKRLVLKLLRLRWQRRLLREILLLM